MTEKVKAVLYAVAAAVFYALIVPCSKLLLDKIAPTYMAAFLYLGAGAGVGIMYLFHHKHEVQTERLEKKDLPYTVGMILLDIIAPILLMLGVKLPEIKYILPAVVLGFDAYGLSIFTYIRAQKTLGAAKTSTFYAIAPFIGAMLSFIFLCESLTITYMIAFGIMVLGTVFVVSETLSTNDSMKEPE